MADPINIYHSKLLEKRAELLQALKQREGIHIDGRAPDHLDEALANSARVVAVDKVNRETALLKRVKKAIDKILHGDFGECDGCGELLPESRLLAVPWAENCIHCQYEKEQKGLI